MTDPRWWLVPHHGLLSGRREQGTAPERTRARAWEPQPNPARDGRR